MWSHLPAILIWDYSLITALREHARLYAPR